MVGRNTGSRQRNKDGERIIQLSYEDEEKAQRCETTLHTFRYLQAVQQNENRVHRVQQ